MTKSANKPFYYQVAVGDGKRPYEFTAHEINMIKNYKGLDGYVLYETANFTRMNKNGEIEGSPHIKKLIET